MKVNKIEKVEFELQLSREDMDALKEIAKEWRNGTTSREQQTAVSVGGPTEAEKERVADIIMREGKITRGH